MEDASFMEIGSARIMDQELKSRIGPQKRKEGVVIYEKRLRLRGCWRYKSGSCRWSVTDGASGA